MEKKILSGNSFAGTLSENEIKAMKESAKFHYTAFLKALGYDVDNDPNMKDTPARVVKMYVDEICRGTYQKAPRMKVFPNAGEFKYNGIVFSGKIDLKSLCSHHLCFISGDVYVAYVPGRCVLGLSKLNRYVDWCARRPQLQEHLTTQIHQGLSDLLIGNEGVAVLIEGHHTCVSMRGVEQNSVMMTSKLSGCFLEKDNLTRTEFYEMIKNCKR